MVKKYRIAFFDASTLIIRHIEGMQNLLQVFDRERVLVEFNSLQLAEKSSE